MKKPKETKTVAVFDASNVLIGSAVVPSDQDGIDFGDLPTNGTYKYDGQRFIPLGHGFDKPKTGAPHSVEYVVTRIVEAMGDNAPAEAIAFAKWFDQYHRQREEELATVRLRTGR
jgi:hypothetical protein